MMKKQVFILVTLLLPLVASAYDLADDKGLFYNLKGDGTLEVVGLGAETTTADILSDVSIGGLEYRVTSIGERAFEGRSDLTYLSIPWSVTAIGEYAFIDCGSNIAVNIADPESWCQMELGNEHSSPLSSAGKVLVHDIETTIIDIPDGVASIGNFTFYQCHCITSLTISSSVKSIGSSAFEDCTGLTSLTFSEGLESIGGSAFQGCIGLKSLSIPSTVNTISINAFSNCTGITDVYCYAENVPTTDENAFDGTPTENSILHVPANVIEAYKAVKPWSDFKEIVAIEGETHSVKRTIHVATAGTLKDFISDDEKYQIEELTLTGELNGTDFYFIRQMAGTDYRERSGPPVLISTPGQLYSLDLADVQIVEGGIDYLQDYWGARVGTRTGGGNHFTINNCISSLLFENTKLQSIIIPSSVTSIDASAFCNCKVLKTLVVGGNNQIYDSRDNCNAIIETSSNTLIAGCKKTIIPNSVTSIGNDAFYGCSGLTSITIPESVTSIGDDAFRNCTGLISITIPNNVTSIGNSAFSGCSGLTSVTIPNSVTSIGNYAFSGCSGLNTIRSYIEWPFSIYNSFSEETYSNAQLIVPKDKKWFYQNTEGWNKFKNIVESGDGGVVGEIINVDNVNYKIGEDNTMSVTYSAGGYHNDNYLGDVVIHDYITYNGVIYTVSSIEGDAFAKGIYATGLTSVTIPSTIHSIGSEAFADQYGMKAVYITDLEAWCNIIFKGYPRWSNPLSRAGHIYLNGEEIKDLVIPTGVTTINNGAFCGSTGLTSVSIPNGVTSIGSRAFEGCTGLGIIHIGNGVKEIGEKAFANININMNETRADEEGIEVYCYAEGVPNTSEDAFDGTPTEKSTLYVPANSVVAYKSVWPWSDFKEIVPLSNDPLTDKGIIFTVKDDCTLEVTGLEDRITAVDILSTVTIDGKEYQVTSIGKRAFEGRDDIEYLSIPWSVTYIGEFAFIDCGNNMTVNIADPEAWCKMEIGNEHSSPLSHAKKVLVYDIETDQIDIPEGVTSIGKYTFYQCQCIKSLYIPATVKSIESSAFEGCAGLSSLTLSDGLESIGGSAFEGCTGLNNLVIPSTVNAISINAFKNCKGIIDVYCYAEIVPNTDENVFDGTPTEKSILHVPDNSVEFYKAVRPWSDFREIVALTDDGPNGILVVKQSVDNENLYYDLYGRRIHQPQQKGLYIRNGKKIVVK